MTYQCEKCGFMSTFIENCPLCHDHKEMTQYECGECGHTSNMPGTCPGCYVIMKERRLVQVVR